MDYECHVTVSCESARIEELRGLIECVEWTFSRITGDPLLGEHVFCYATNHYTDLVEAIAYTQAMAVALQIASFDVRRRKVEQIMMDERFTDGEWVTV